MYRAALHLAEIAKQAGLLRDPLVRNILRTVVIDDDPELEKDAEAYIGLRAIERMTSRYGRKQP
jgi:hypothetical protein